jgi:hypothetical protein
VLSGSNAGYPLQPLNPAASSKIAMCIPRTLPIRVTQPQPQNEHAAAANGAPQEFRPDQRRPENLNFPRRKCVLAKAVAGAVTPGRRKLRWRSSGSPLILRPAIPNRQRAMNTPQ